MNVWEKRRTKGLDCFFDRYYRNTINLFMFSVAFIHIHVPKYWFYLRLFIPKRSGLFLRTHRVVTKTNWRWLLSFSRKLFWQDYSVFWLRDYAPFLIASRSLTPWVTHVLLHIKRPSFPLTFCWIIPLVHQILLHLHYLLCSPHLLCLSRERASNGFRL